MRTIIFTLSLIISLSLTWSASALAVDIENVDVYRVPGRFGGWPANHGIWSWGDEILVGFGAGYYKDLGPERHNIDHDKAGGVNLLARSLDGGRTYGRLRIRPPKACSFPWARRCTA